MPAWMRIPRSLTGASTDVKKVVVTLNIGNYQPAIRSLTYPLMQRFAEKIHADFVEITERKFPEWPTVMEKFQTREIGNRLGADWTLFFDADALISPEMFDPTTHLTKDTVLFNGKDMSEIRFFADKYFLRDGRRIGACDWFCCCSDWTRDDLYSFPDLSLEECVKNINVTIGEQNSGLFKDNHLIDDYVLSRNAARYGLHHDTLIDLCGRMGFRNQFGNGVSPYFFHLYAIDDDSKVGKLLETLVKPKDQGGWGLQTPDQILSWMMNWRMENKIATMLAQISKPLDQGGWALMSPQDVLDFKAHWKLK